MVRTARSLGVGLALVVGLVGCQGPMHTGQARDEASPTAIQRGLASASAWEASAWIQTDSAEGAAGQVAPVVHRGPTVADGGQIEEPSPDDPQALVDQALATHPLIRRLGFEAQAAWARLPQVRALPDPMARGSVFGEPLVTAVGETRGTLMLSQTIPSLKRLDAQGQQAAFEALIRDEQVRAARLRVAADVREAWAQLYLLGQLLRINATNAQLVESLVTIASALVDVGQATAGDVILGTVELSRLEEQRVVLEQQLESRKAMLNQLLNRPADSPLGVPSALQPAPVRLVHEELRGLAWEYQPAVIQAQLDRQATAWGVRVAQLEQIPSLTFSYERTFLQVNPGSGGSDAWQVGVGLNVPVWRQKYLASQREARQRHFGAQMSLEEVQWSTDAALLDLLEQARAAEQTADLYQSTILPQTRQGLEADQRAYGQGAVQFERVIGGARTLLTAEAAYHRAVAERSIALARLEQTVGWPLPQEAPRLPPEGEPGQR